MTDYYDKQRAKVAIAHELQDHGWKLYGYHADQSDIMTDYWCPASWDGIATKDGYVLCIGIYGTRDSGRQVTEQSYQVDHEKIRKLQTLASDSGATADEKLAALGRIEVIKQQARDSVRVIDTWPTYQDHPGRAVWHLEKDGAILAKGTGVYSLLDCNDREGTKTRVSAFVGNVEKAMSSTSEVVAESVKVRKTVKQVQETGTGSLSVGQIIIVKSPFTGGVYPGAFQCVRQTGTSFVFARLSKRLDKTMSTHTPGNSLWIRPEWLEKYMSKGSIAWGSVVDVEEVTTKTVYKKAKRTQESAATATIEGDTVPETENSGAVRIALNDEYHGIEIRFPDKPEEGTREQLKSYGFRWSRFQGIWYAKQSPERLRFAQSLNMG